MAQHLIVGDTLQSVTNAGSITTNSVKIKSTTIDDNGTNPSIITAGGHNMNFGISDANSLRILTNNLIQIVISNNGAVRFASNSPNGADNSAQLEVASTSKGVLFPRMTTAQKNAISSPAEGLIVYDLTLHKLCVYTGAAWETVTSV